MLIGTYIFTKKSIKYAEFKTKDLGPTDFN